MGNLRELVDCVKLEAKRGDLDLVVQLVGNPRGRGKRKLDKTLECELIRKKKRHLYVIATSRRSERSDNGDHH